VINPLNVLSQRADFRSGTPAIQPVKNMIGVTDVGADVRTDIRSVLTYAKLSQR